MSAASAMRFRLDRRGGRLLRLDAGGAAVPVAIGSRALGVLCALADRPGELVSKQEILDAVWPNTIVEDKNLAVQVSALRQALEREGGQGHLIQTVPGRGYRLEAPLDELERPEPPQPVPLAPAATAASWWHRPPFLAALLLATTLGLGGLVLAVVLPGLRVAQPPRLSLVVLPFQNLGSDASDDYLADAITDDLTTDLSHLQGSLVIAHASASSYKGRGADVKQIGQDLGVRYVLEGSVRRLGGVIRVNAQVVSAETGTQLWSDRFDEDIRDLNAGQNEIVTRLRATLGVTIIDAESLRSARERPATPDAFDLYLRARSLWWNQPYSRQRSVEALALYERALVLDPSSVPAMLGVADVLIEQSLDGDPDADTRSRAAALVSRARAIEPNSEAVLGEIVFLLRAQERWPELSEAAQKLINAYPNSVRGYHHLATAKFATGHAEEAIPLLETAIRLSPRAPEVYHRYKHLAYALLLAGRDSEAIGWAQRSLATYPEADADYRSRTNRYIAAAQALTGHSDEARLALAEANRLWPFDTVRSHSPDDLSSQANAAQIRRLQEGLRLAGERDHADEGTDFGVVPDGSLRLQEAGPTPMTEPGAMTIWTGELAAMLAARKPIVIDAVGHFWGRSLPGAIGLEKAGLGGSVGDAAQDRLRKKMHELTGGDMLAPIVAVGWNSERFDGPNLALRLVALGYTQVFWYRGGREAWEAAGLPETEATVQDW